MSHFEQYFELDEISGQAGGAHYTYHPALAEEPFPGAVVGVDPGLMERESDFDEVVMVLNENGYPVVTVEHTRRRLPMPPDLLSRHLARDYHNAWHAVAQALTAGEESPDEAYLLGMGHSMGGRVARNSMAQMALGQSHNDQMLGIVELATPQGISSDMDVLDVAQGLIEEFLTFVQNPREYMEMMGGMLKRFISNPLLIPAEAATVLFCDKQGEWADEALAAAGVAHLRAFHSADLLAPDDRRDPLTSMTMPGTHMQYYFDPEGVLGVVDRLAEMAHLQPGVPVVDQWPQMQ